MKYYISALILICCISLQAQLTLEKDINIEPASSDPGHSFVELNGIIYYRADDGMHDEELYAYNPTTGESWLTADIRTESGPNGMEETIAYADKIYYASRANSSTRYLYAYDPSTKETIQVRDADNQRVREPSNFHVYDGRLFYRSEISSNADEVHVYDANDNTTRSLGNVRMDGRSSAGNFNTVADRLYFSAFSGTTDSNIWYYDMASDTIHQYAYTQTASEYGAANQLTYFDGWLFYSDGISQSRGTTTAIDLSTAEAMQFSIFANTPSGEQPNDFFPFAGRLYFSAFSNSPKRALYAFDPATTDVTKILQIMPDASTAPYAFTELDGKMYMTVQTSTDDDPKTHIYSYDHSDDTFADEATLDTDDNVGYLTIHLADDGLLYCSGYREDVGRELFKYDPISSDLSLVTDLNTNTASANPYALTEYNGQLYFVADAYLVGGGIYRYDPTTGATTRVVSDIFRPRSLIVAAGRLYVDGSIDGGGYGLNYYDAITDKIVATSWRTPSCINCMNDFILYDDKIYMSVQIDEDIGTELYAYDPVTDTGELIADISSEGDSRPTTPLIIGDDLYFSAVATDQDELYRHNASSGTVELVRDSDTQESLIRPSAMVVLNEKIYCAARRSDNLVELYTYDPGTEKITQLTEESTGMRPTDLVVHDEKIFFAGNPNNTIGRELHSYDPNTDNVTLELDLTPGSGGSLLFWRSLTSFNDKLYFSHSTDDFGSEFWEYADGEARIIADIRQGTLESSPQLFTVFNDKLYFVADDGDTGQELWSYASCINAIVETDPANPWELGSIDISVTGGTAPYSYLWNDGVTTEDRSDVEAGIYTVRIYDISGCIVTITVEITFSTATTDTENSASLSIYPNPSAGLVQIVTPANVNGTIYVLAADGRLVLSTKVINGQSDYRIDLSGLPVGQYVVSLVTAEQQISRSISIVE